VRGFVPQELARIQALGAQGRFERAAEIFVRMSTHDTFEEFLTLPLYEEI
jgi:malate synthase